jgi:hypothetical protein
LSPRGFERLILAYLLREGYTKAQHYGSGGPERGRDITALRNGDLWYVQCKRVKTCGAKVFLTEIEKIVALGETDPAFKPKGILFAVSCDASALARDTTTQRCAELGMDCEIWARSDLDARIKRHPDIVAEFFSNRLQPAEDLSALVSVSPDPSASELTEAEEDLLAQRAFESPNDIEQGIEHVQQLLRVGQIQLTKAQVPEFSRPMSSMDLVQMQMWQDELRERIEVQKDRLLELTQALRITRQVGIPGRMLIKDFLAGNLYGVTIDLFADSLPATFDTMDLVERISQESPEFRRRVALRLLNAPEADDYMLAEALGPLMERLAQRPGTGYIEVYGNRYRKVRY